MPEILRSAASICSAKIKQNQWRVSAFLRSKGRDGASEAEILNPPLVSYKTMPIETEIDPEDLKQAHEYNQIYYKNAFSLYDLKNGMRFAAHIPPKVAKEMFSHKIMQFRGDGTVVLTKHQLKFAFEYLIEKSDKLRTLEIGVIDSDGWKLLSETYDLKNCLGRIVCLKDYEQFEIEFIRLFGVPSVLCCIDIVDGKKAITSKNVKLVPGDVVVYHYHQILFRRPILWLCREYPYEPRKIRNIIDLLDKVHGISERSFRKKYLKMDYEFEILRNYKEFNRLQNEDKCSNIPVFWYDPVDFHADSTIDVIKEKLAIEDEWLGQKLFIVTYGFPTGAIFLKCKVEAQKTKKGGGVEYLYLGNIPKESVKFIRSQAGDPLPMLLQ